MRCLAVMLCPILCCFASAALGATWTTRSPGYWSSNATWQGGASPPYTTGDTIILKHPVLFGQHLTLAAGAYLKIDSTGGLCGHHNLSVQTGATVRKLGILEVDTLYVPGGTVTCLGPGDVIITWQGQVSNGGQMSVNGCYLAVGPWFSCRLPEYSFALGLEERASQQVRLSPNPAREKLTLDGLPRGVTVILTLTDATGRTVWSRQATATATGITFSCRGLPPGIYYWRLNGGTAVGQGKVVIQP